MRESTHARRRARRGPVLVLLLSMLVAMGTGVYLWQDMSSLPSVGNRAAALAATESSAAAAPAAPSSVDDRAMLQRLGSPAAVRIEALRIEAPVIPVGLVDGDVLEVPKDIDKVGWYEFGPRPGSSTGSSVLVAHRDGTTQGRGVFFALDALDVDSTVQVVTSTGFVLPYRVIAVEGIRRAEFQADIEEFFAVDGPPRLTLITCGGEFDQANGGYQANVVVTAVPISTLPSQPADNQSTSAA